MMDKRYRASLRIEEINQDESCESKLVEQIELATFRTLEEALTCRQELTLRYSPEAEVLNQRSSPKAFLSEEASAEAGRPLGGRSTG